MHSTSLSLAFPQARGKGSGVKFLYRSKLCTKSASLGVSEPGAIATGPRLNLILRTCSMKNQQLVEFMAGRYCSRF
jgi:hypothetical protein